MNWPSAFDTFSVVSYLLILLQNQLNLTFNQLEEFDSNCTKFKWEQKTDTISHILDDKREHIECRLYC